jgi:hypothetical protein
MTPDGSILLDHHACELCRRYRARLPRAWGIDWIDGYWACAACIMAYRIELAAGGKGAYARAIRA